MMKRVHQGIMQGLCLAWFGVVLSACSASVATQQTANLPALGDAIGVKQTQVKVVMTPRVETQLIVFDSTQQILIYFPKAVTFGTKSQLQYLDIFRQVGEQLRAHHVRALLDCHWDQRGNNLYLATHSKQMVGCALSETRQYFYDLRASLEALENVLERQYKAYLLPEHYHADRMILELTMASSYRSERVQTGFMGLYRVKGGLLAKTPFTESQDYLSGAKVKDAKAQRQLDDWEDMIETQRKKVIDTSTHALKVLQCFSTNCKSLALGKTTHEKASSEK